MASGAFPVVSDEAGNREWLSGNGDSLLFDPSDENRLADCIHEAIRNGELRHAAVPINRSTVEDRGEREKNLASLERAYVKLWEDCCRPPTAGLK